MFMHRPLYPVEKVLWYKLDGWIGGLRAGFHLVAKGISLPQLGINPLPFSKQLRFNVIYAFLFSMTTFHGVANVEPPVNSPVPLCISPNNSDRVGCCTELNKRRLEQCDKCVPYI
jgi:hypothetical protein